MQEKADDRYTTPLCHYHRQSGIQPQHKVAEEVFWREIHGRNPFEIADGLWIEFGGAARAVMEKPAHRMRPVNARKPREQRARIVSAKRTIASRSFSGTPIPSISKQRNLSTADGCCKAPPAAASSLVYACEPAKSDFGRAFPKKEERSPTPSPVRSPQNPTQQAQHSTCSSCLPVQEDALGNLTEHCEEQLPKRYPVRGTYHELDANPSVGPRRF